MEKELKSKPEGFGILEQFLSLGAIFPDPKVDFAPVEKNSAALNFTVDEILNLIYQKGAGDLIESSCGFCADPRGGIPLATVLAQEAGTAGDRLEYDLIFPEIVGGWYFLRHTPTAGNWLFVTDVLNEFSRVRLAYANLASFDARICGVICFCNLTSSSTCRVKEGLELPIFSLLTLEQGRIVLDTDLSKLEQTRTRAMDKLSPATAEGDLGGCACGGAD